MATGVKAPVLPTSTLVAVLPPAADPSVAKLADRYASEAPADVRLEAPTMSRGDRPDTGEGVPLSPDPDVDPDGGDSQVPAGEESQQPGETGRRVPPGEEPQAEPRDLAVGGTIGEFDPFKVPRRLRLAEDLAAGEMTGEVAPFDSPLVQPPADVVAQPAAEGHWVWPVRGVISQGYSSAHRAIDIDTAQGTVVGAADTGRVVYAKWEISGYGYLVIVDHGNGYVSYYAHLYGFYVDVGQTVARGQQIGELGNTGDSTGPHLHFEIRYDGVQRNPLDLLPER